MGQGKNQSKRKVVSLQGDIPLDVLINPSKVLREHFATELNSKKQESSLDYIKSQINEFGENITLEKINKKLNLPETSEISPIRVLEYISKDYSGIWKTVEYRVIYNMMSGSFWNHEQIFLPIFYWLPMLLNIKHPNWRKDKRKDKLPYMPTFGIDFISICAIGTWRYTKGIYKIDDEIASHFFIDDTDIKIPSTVLKNQPEWSIFVDTKNLNLSLNDEKVIGFWSNINCFPSKEEGLNNGTANLIIVPLFSKEVGYLLSASIPLDDNQFLSIEKSKDFLLNFFTECNINYEDKSTQIELNELNNFKKKIVQILMFIFQPEPDITEHDKPIHSNITNPYPKRIKGEYRLFEAKKPRYFNVGTQAGKSLKQALATYKATGKTQAPHIRRAHWHGFWKGSRKNNAQEFFYKWVAPVIVNGDLVQEKN